MKIQAYSKTQLARMYNVSYETFKNWLKPITDLNLDPKYRVLTPKQVSIIIAHLGEPE